MQALLNEWFPNLIRYWPEFLVSIGETLTMMFYAGFFSILFGLIFGVILVVTRDGNILQNKPIHHIIDKTVNTLRSIPFLILIIMLTPLTLFFFGTAIAIRGAVPPMVVGCTPFVVRQIEMALSSVDPGLIEAAQAMGVSPWGIIFRVYLRESIPQIIRSITITLISLLDLSAMAGAVGAGGLGAFVIRYGRGRFFSDIIYVSVLVLIIMVMIMQSIGNVIAKKTTH